MNWIDTLISLGPDYCNYFEHMMIELGHKPTHNPNGCYWCAQEAT